MVLAWVFWGAGALMTFALLGTAGLALVRGHVDFAERSQFVKVFRGAWPVMRWELALAAGLLAASFVAR